MENVVLFAVLAALGVTMYKDRWWVLFFSVVLFPLGTLFGAYSAFRLAPPWSSWAKRFYKADGKYPEKMLASVERYGLERYEREDTKFTLPAGWVLSEDRKNVEVEKDPPDSGPVETTDGPFVP